MITIYHCDCREIDDWDIAGAFMVTDPPYGISLSSGWSGRFDDCAIENDESVDARDEFLQVVSATRFGFW